MSPVNVNLKGTVRELQTRMKTLQNDLNKRMREIETVQNRLNRAQEVVKAKTLENTNLKKELRTVVQKNIRLEKELERLKRVRPMLKVDNLAGHIRSSMEKLNEEARKGRVRTVIDSLEVEIKGGVSLKDGVHITQLLPDETAPESVSTIRLVMRPAPNIKIVDESE